MSETANPVLDRALAHLEQYGYRAPVTEIAADWARLKSDFGESVPDLAELGGAARKAADRYLALKYEADELLAACEAAHREILGEGLGPERTERYAVVRDAYEEKVEEFGAARAALAVALPESL
jgi:hypothetical protein